MYILPIPREANQVFSVGIENVSKNISSTIFHSSSLVT